MPLWSNPFVVSDKEVLGSILDTFNLIVNRICHFKMCWLSAHSDKIMERKKQTKGGAVDAERSRALLVREINEKQKIPGSPPAREIFKK